MKGFELILDNNETILKTYKPNKKRFILINLLCGIPALLLPGIFLLIGILMLNNVIVSTDEAGNVSDHTGAIFFIIFASIFLVFILVGIISTFFKYKKALYCVTNKRIIIRHGFIGVDFRSLNLDAIGAVNVEVNFLDKLIKPNTGKITFASASAPMVNANQKGQFVPFEFACVDNPYEVYREVKEIISENTSKENS